MTRQEHKMMVPVGCQVVIPAVSGRTRLPWTPDKIPNWDEFNGMLKRYPLPFPRLSTLATSKSKTEIHMDFAAGNLVRIPGDSIRVDKTVFTLEVFAGCSDCSVRVDRED